MGKEPVPLFGRAPGRARDLLNAERSCLLSERGPKIELGGPTQPKARGNLRAHFITLPANTNPAMHYNVARLGKRAPLEELDPPRECARGRAPPAGVDDGDRTGLRNRQVDGDAIGDGDGEQHPALGGGVPVEAVENEPPLRQRLVPANLDTMDLIAEYDGPELWSERRAKGAPAAHDLSDRLITPEAEAQRACRNARNQAEALSPVGQLEARDGSIADGRQRPSRRSSCAPKAFKRSSIRS